MSSTMPERYKKKLEYLQTHRYDAWLEEFRRVETELSDKQLMFCVCGRLATGLHERLCRKFRDRVIRETAERLDHLCPVGIQRPNGKLLYIRKRRK